MLLGGLVACTGSGTEPTTPAPTAQHAAAEEQPAREVVANISYRLASSNLVANGDFEDYSDPNVPNGWGIDEIYGYRGMFSPVDAWRGRGVQLTRNAHGQHLLTQTVTVEPNHRYIAQLVYQVVETDSSNGGFYVVDPADGSVIGNDTINRPSNGWRLATVAFDSGERTQVTIELGYPAGMNGTVVYDAVSLVEAAQDLEYRYQTTYRDIVGIPDQPVETLVPALADYITTLLAAPLAERMAHRDANAVELPYYLYSFLSAPDGEGARASWCQRTSLALAELLAMYGVHTRQIHSRSLQHQFLEYFDGKKWVVFDPYYGVRYVLNGKRLGVEETIQAGMDQTSIEVPTREHVFLLELGYLKPIWQAGAFVRGIEM